jgi:hypothetical protein
MDGCAALKPKEHPTTTTIRRMDAWTGAQRKLFGICSMLPEVITSILYLFILTIIESERLAGQRDIQVQRCVPMSIACKMPLRREYFPGQSRSIHYTSSAKSSGMLSEHFVRNPRALCPLSNANTSSDSRSRFDEGVRGGLR